MKTSNLTTAHHSSISSYALKFFFFEKIICIKVNQVFQIRGDQNLARAKTTGATLPRVDYSPWFLFRRLKIEKKKKKKSSLLLSLSL